MSRETPPLWSWALAATLATTILAALVLDPVNGGSLTDLNLARLQGPAGGAPLIVLIGSSKLRCGVDYDGEIADALKTQGVTARVVRVAYPSADYAHLKPVFAALEAARPAVVLLEDDLLLRTRTRAHGPNLRSWRQTARQTLRLRLGLDHNDFNDGPEARTPCGTAPPRQLTPNDLADYQYFLGSLHTSSAADRALYLDQLARLRATGARTGLITLTRSPAAMAVFPPTLGVAARQALAGTPGVVRLAPPRQFPQSAYADFGHLNAEGRRRYMAWLVPHLAELVGPGHD